MVTITVEKIEDFNEVGVDTALDLSQSWSPGAHADRGSFMTFQMHAHPYYAEFITPDELRFGDPAKVLVMVGYDEPKIVDRKVVRGVTA